jgi:hypothetical protein
VQCIGKHNVVTFYIFLAGVFASMVFVMLSSFGTVARIRGPPMAMRGRAYVDPSLLLGPSPGVTPQPTPPLS